jgi:hypothetical protein
LRRRRPLTLQTRASDAVGRLPRTRPRRMPSPPLTRAGCVRSPRCCHAPGHSHRIDVQLTPSRPIPLSRQRHSCGHRTTSRGISEWNQP